MEGLIFSATRGQLRFFSSRLYIQYPAEAHPPPSQVPTQNKLVQDGQRGCCSSWLRLLRAIKTAGHLFVLWHHVVVRRYKADQQLLQHHPFQQRGMRWRPEWTEPSTRSFCSARENQNGQTVFWWISWNYYVNTFNASSFSLFTFYYCTTGFSPSFPP